MEIKDILKQRRIEMNLTMREVADAVGVSEGTISRWESGDIANMRRDKIMALAEALRISPRVIMGWDPEEEQPAYYINDESAQVAQEVYEDPDLRLLFDAARDSKPENIRLAADLLRRLKGTNPDG